MSSKSHTTYRQRRVARQRRVRAKIFGTATRPRVCIHRSLREMYVQFIDDNSSQTLLAVHSKTAILDGDAGDRIGNTAIAYKLGRVAAKVAESKNIKQVVFDRSGYAYHGRVKAVAEGLRDGGIIV